MGVEDVTAAVIGVLEGAGLAPVYARRLSRMDGREGLVVRPGSVRTARRYIDGSREAVLPVRVICKRRSAADAMGDAEAATDALDGATVVVDGNAAAVEASDETVQELEYSDADWSVWMATANVYYEEGPRK